MQIFDQVTLNKMAKESFSSTSSVLRFCKKLVDPHRHYK